MKKIFSYILFIMIGINVFGFSGNLFGEKDLKIIKTKWLDIIYPESCEDSATVLYANGDRIFQEVTKQYGLEPDFRLPVVITPTIDLYNAFYTPAPYNRIVLFDTSTQTLDDLSSSFSENLLSTFRHELTHAVTYNMKNGFWKGFSKVFGDVMVPGYFFVTSGMAEGAAVASESTSGEGRLNDEYAKHLVKQAKIEGKFPSYYDVQGAGDNMIPGIQYYFNGPFHQWLQEKYGMEKYNDFWHKVINMNRVGVNWSFKKVYGQSVRNAWKEFEESYKVPELSQNPVKENLTSDFFEKNKEDFSILNKSGAIYTDLSVNEKGLFYLEKKSQKVFFVDKNHLGNEKIKPKVLFTQKGIDNITTTKDGKFVVVSYYSNVNPGVTGKIKIYNVEKNQFYNVKENGVKNGAIIKENNDYFLICHKYDSPKNIKIVKKLNITNGKIINEEDFWEKENNRNEFSTNFLDLGNGYFSYINKNGKTFSIKVADIQGKNEKEYFMPEGTSIRQLSQNGSKLFFSYVQKCTMPRLGSLDLESGKIGLSTKDISGGIFNPVIYDLDNCQKIAFIGSFFQGNKLETAELNKYIEENHTIEIENHKNNEITQESKENSQILDITLKSENYKWYKNLHKGVIIPFSIYETENIGFDFTSENKNFRVPVGITYGTTTPWSNGYDDLFIATAGWNYLENSFGFETILSKGTPTDLFSYNVDLKTEFDLEGWKKSSGGITLSSAFNFGMISTFYVENFLKLEGANHKSFNITEILNVGYSNIHKTGPGRFEKAGFTAAINSGFIYDTKAGIGLIINPEITAEIPKLIPINQQKGFVYNLPTKLSVSIMPVGVNHKLNNLNFHKPVLPVINGTVETVLFGLDIQKSIPYVEPFFFQNFNIVAGYGASVVSYKKANDFWQIPYFVDYLKNLEKGQSLYVDTFYLQINLDFSLNIGILANRANIFNIYGRISYPFNGVLPSNRKFCYNLGFLLKF